MLKIATSQYDFARLREGGYVYVDKTDLLARLAMNTDDAQYFIARPRRFGKSLMLSTLHYLFEGRRDLFRGLKIEKTKWDWSKTYPVVHLDMSKVRGPTPAELEENLFNLAKSIAKRFSLRDCLCESGSASYAFSRVLDGLAEKAGRFVVLIDEYDLPLQGFLGTGDVNTVRQIMHDFYMQFKSHLGSIRFLMITGVTKLTKLSLFSGLNNPTDLTMDEPLCAGILGYTKDEIRTYFSDWLSTLAKKRKKSVETVLQELLDWYDSYRFCPDSNVRVCNPISIGRALASGKILSYWVKTATATLLVERMRDLNATWKDFETVLATRDELDVCDAIEMPLVPLMYQAGYLTIKGKSKTEKDEYGFSKLILGIPNHEVRGALKGAFWNQLMQIEEKSFTALVHVAEKQIAAGDIEGLIGETLYRLYAKLPPTWTPKTEQDAKRYFLLFMEMAGATMHAEKPSARGFADAVVETKKGVWIFEFKFNRSAASAIRQIRERGYAEPFVDAAARRVKKGISGSETTRRDAASTRPGAATRRDAASTRPGAATRRDAASTRPITLVGIKFDSARKNIDMPRMEAL